MWEARLISCKWWCTSHLTKHLRHLRRLSERMFSVCCLGSKEPFPLVMKGRKLSPSPQHPQENVCTDCGSYIFTVCMYFVNVTYFNETLKVKVKIFLLSKQKTLKLGIDKIKTIPNATDEKPRFSLNFTVHTLHLASKNTFSSCDDYERPHDSLLWYYLVFDITHKPAAIQWDTTSTQLHWIKFRPLPIQVLG